MHFEKLLVEKFPCFSLALSAGKEGGTCLFKVQCPDLLQFEKFGAGQTVGVRERKSLVCGGELVMRRAQEKGVEIVPVDSEHSALFQALSFRRDTPFERLVLTASGIE